MSSREQGDRSVRKVGAPEENEGPTGVQSPTVPCAIDLAGALREHANTVLRLERKYICERLLDISLHTQEGSVARNEIDELIHHLQTEVGP